ncbi:MAG: signal peptidase I [Thermoanaerobaculia bacterium]
MSDETAAKKSTAREYFEALLIALIFVNFARIFVFQAFKIPTASMVDNLLVGDHIIVNKFVDGPPAIPAFKEFFPFREIHRGDIAVFRYPRDPAVDYVKRVIGLPGETVTIRDKVVYINGQALAEPYALHSDPEIYRDYPGLPEVYRLRDQFGPYTVPPGTYFMMGDNRDKSYDSRYWGTVPRSMIKGKPVLVYWSYRSPSSYESENATATGKVEALLGVATHFFTRTRWYRTFFIIDSDYHHVEGPDKEL